MKIWMTCEKLTEGCAPNVTVLEIRNNLKKMNHEVLLFCPGTERRHAPVGESDIKFVPTLNIRWLGDVLYQFLLAFSMLVSCLKSRPNWIYTRFKIYMISPALISKLIRVPHIVHLSGDTVDQLRGTGYHPLFVAIYAMVEKINCKLSDRVVVTTFNNKANHQRRHRLPADRVVVIENGANTDLFRPIDIAQARKEVGIEKDCLCVGFVGNLWVYEGVPHFIEAAPMILREIPTARFFIVGDGPMKEELVELTEKAGVSDKFMFTGRVPYKTVPVYIAAMDIGVVPLDTTKCKKTGISSIKLREYLACGRPVVGSDIDGVGNVLREANAGFAVIPENTSDFAQAIVRLLRDRAPREEMGKNGRKYVLENLSWEVSTRKLVEAYESAAAESRR